MDLVTGALITLIAAGAIASGAPGTPRYYPNTIINGCDISNMDYQTAKDELIKHYMDEHKIFHVTDRDGNQYDLDLTDFLRVDLYTYDLESQNDQMGLFNHGMTDSIEYRLAISNEIDDYIREKIINSGNFQKPPANASVISDENGIDIIPEDPGTMIESDQALIDAIKASIYIGNTDFVITDQYYKKPDVTSESIKLQKDYNREVRFHNSDISYKIGEHTFPLEYQIFSPWVHDNIVNAEMAMQWINEICEEAGLASVDINIRGKAVNIQIPCSVLVDKESFLNYLTNDLLYCTKSSRFAPYRIDNGQLMCDYLDVDLDEKKVYRHTAENVDVEIGTVLNAEFFEKGCYAVNEPAGLICIMDNEKIMISKDTQPWFECELNDMASDISDICLIIIH